MSWQDKAHAVIAVESNKAWKAANILPSGRRRRRHVPYGIPALARELIRCLAENDEETAKDLFQRRAIFGDSYTLD